VSRPLPLQILATNQLVHGEGLVLGKWDVYTSDAALSRSCIGGFLAVFDLCGSASRDGDRPAMDPQCNVSQK